MNCENKELDTIIKTVLNKRYSEKFSNLITKILVIAENNRIDFINLENQSLLNKSFKNSILSPE